jgi:Bacterial PH domain
MKHYKAHWGILLVVISTVLTVLCLGLACSEFVHKGVSAWTGWLLLALVAGCGFFCVRGYTVTPDAILIHRLGWNTRLPLAGLQSARREWQSPWLGIRIGNGGFFSFTGWRWSPGLGFYRVFVTNGADRVVLRYAHRTVVVSPSAPDDFVRELAVATS